MGFNLQIHLTGLIQLRKRVKHVTYTVGLYFTSETVESYLALSLCGLVKTGLLSFMQRKENSFSSSECCFNGLNNSNWQNQEIFPLQLISPTDKWGWL